MSLSGVSGARKVRLFNHAGIVYRGWGIGYLEDNWFCLCTNMLSLFINFFPVVRLVALFL